MLNDEQKSKLYTHVYFRDDEAVFSYVNTLLAAEREAVIEECARVCEETYPESIGNSLVQLPQFPNDGAHCAVVIRALKGSNNG